MPLHNVYSASKSFVDTFSRAISYEYSPQVDVMSLNPSEVCTPMTFHKKDVFTISPQQCAEGMLDHLGHERQTNGHWSHQLQGALYRAIPERLFNAVWMGVIAPEFMEERRKAQLKQR
jgi:short-subunit dehydrogenase